MSSGILPFVLFNGMPAPADCFRKAAMSRRSARLKRYTVYPEDTTRYSSDIAPALFPRDGYSPFMPAASEAVRGGAAAGALNAVYRRMRRLPPHCRASRRARAKLRHGVPAVADARHGDGISRVYANSVSMRYFDRSSRASSWPVRFVPRVPTTIFPGSKPKKVPWFSRESAPWHEDPELSEPRYNSVKGFEVLWVLQKQPFSAAVMEA